MEHQVKQALLDNPYLFSYLGDLGSSKIVFEKSVNHGKLIADALVFTHNQGIIGVEIKTEYDSLKRLSHQLDNYLQVCNYVTVFIHEKWLKKVEKLLATKHIKDLVGIIVYSDFEGMVIPGVYQPAVRNPYFKIKTSLDMLWKTDIHYLVNKVTQGAVNRVANEHQGQALQAYQHLGQGRAIALSSDLHRPAIGSRSLSKRMLVSQLVNLVGEANATQQLCDLIIDHHYDPNKVLTTYHFNGKKDIQ